MFVTKWPQGEFVHDKKSFYAKPFDAVGGGGGSFQKLISN